MIKKKATATYHFKQTHFTNSPLSVGGKGWSRATGAETSGLQPAPALYGNTFPLI